MLPPHVEQQCRVCCSSLVCYCKWTKCGSVRWHQTPKQNIYAPVTLLCSDVVAFGKQPDGTPLSEECVLPAPGSVPAPVTACVGVMNVLPRLLEVGLTERRRRICGAKKGAGTDAERRPWARLTFHRLNNGQSCNMAVSVMEVLSRGEEGPQLLPTNSALWLSFSLIRWTSELFHNSW